MSLVESIRQRQQQSQRRATATYQLQLADAVRAGDAIDPVATDRLIAAAAAAGISAEQLLTDAELATQPTKERVHLAPSIQFQPGGTPHLKILDLREAIRDAGGRLPLDQYVVIPIRGGQTDDDARELWQTVQDYNAGTPGSCDLGVVLVVREGFPRGTPQQTGSASWIASRFKLWQLRLARCEVEVLAARAGGAFDRKDAFLARLGLGALREPVYSGD
jgi:hypothetical protein